ncbi:MAG: GNVR domain-containing protein, partial [Pyrinomonadaceae bacterium]
TAQLDQTERQLADLQQRINSIPTAAVALEALNRDYQTKKTYYDDLLAKKQKADLAAGVATNAQGEAIQVVDPANVPQRPVAPKRGILMLLGLFAGLGAGLSLAAVFEVPRLLTVQTKEDVEHYTGLPVLVSVPDLHTPDEARRMPMRRALLLAAGIVLTIVSIPTFAYILQLTRIFDRFA